MPALHDGLIKFALAAAAFLLFMGSFEANQLLDALMLYAPGVSLIFIPAGVSLIFIPAGVKLLCLLVGGWPAALGLIASSIYLSIGLWTQLSFLSSIYFALIGVSNYWIAVYLVMRRYKIKPDLSNLNYWHVIALSVVASVLNGFSHNVVFWMQGVTQGSEFLRKSAAMAFGDFLGCFVVVMLFNICISLPRSLRPSNPG